MLLTPLSFALALILALILMPVLMKLAPTLGLEDKPDQRRKLHKTPIPMVGGLAIFASVLFACGVCFYLTSAGFNTGIRFRPNDAGEMIGLAIGAFLLLLVGLIDDRLQMRGRQKLLGQIAAITVLIASGYHFDQLIFAGMTFELGIFSILFVYAWMIIAINSINLLDGADGFASTIGIIMSLSLAAMAILMGRTVDAVVVIALIGAVIAFLKFNFPPAKAYLGDSGSMLIGFILGALAIRCTFKQATLYAFFAPVALLAIPLIDTTAAIIRRRLTGRSIYTVDRGHLHHHLMKSGYSPRVSLLWVALLCSVTGVGGVMAMHLKQSEYAIVSIILVIIVMIFGRIFGLAEFQLLTNKFSGVAGSLVGGKRDADQHRQSSVHVQGNHDWQELWDYVCQFAEENELNQITIDLNLPWLHESFHATRRRSGTKRDQSREWYAEVPLMVDSRMFGRIEVLGDRESRFDHYDVLNNLLKVSPDVEQLIVDSESAVEKRVAVTETSAPDADAFSQSDNVDSVDKDSSVEVR